MTIQYGPSCLGSRKLREHLKQLIPEAIPLLVKKLEADEQQTENGKERRSVRETINGLLNKQAQDLARLSEQEIEAKQTHRIFHGSLGEIGANLAEDCLRNYPPYKPYVRVFINDDGRKVLAISSASFFPAGWPLSDEWIHQIDDENDEWIYWSNINGLNLKGCPQLEYPIEASTPSLSDRRVINLLDYDSLASMDKNNHIFIRHWYKPFEKGRKHQQGQNFCRLEIENGIEKLIELKRFEFDEEFQKAEGDVG